MALLQLRVLSLGFLQDGECRGRRLSRGAQNCGTFLRALTFRGLSGPFFSHPSVYARRNFKFSQDGARMPILKAAPHKTKIARISGSKFWTVAIAITALDGTVIASDR